MIKPNGFISISIMSFWSNSKVFCVLGVSIECFYALDNVAHEKVVLFTCNLDLVSGKYRSLRWKFVVDNSIELYRVFE